MTLLSGYRRGVDSCPLAEAAERFDLAVCGLVVKERLLVGVGSREKGEAFAHGTADRLAICAVPPLKSRGPVAVVSGRAPMRPSALSSAKT